MGQRIRFFPASPGRKPTSTDTEVIRAMLERISLHETAEMRAMGFQSLPARSRPRSTPICPCGPSGSATHGSSRAVAAHRRGRHPAAIVLERRAEARGCLGAGLGLGRKHRGGLRTAWSWGRPLVPEGLPRSGLVQHLYSRHQVSQSMVHLRHYVILTYQI